MPNFPQAQLKRVMNAHLNSADLLDQITAAKAARDAAVPESAKKVLQEANAGKDTHYLARMTYDCMKNNSSAEEYETWKELCAQVKTLEHQQIKVSKRACVFMDFFLRQLVKDIVDHARAVAEHQKAKRIHSKNIIAETDTGSPKYTAFVSNLNTYAILEREAHKEAKPDDTEAAADSRPADEEADDGDAGCDSYVKCKNLVGSLHKEHYSAEEEPIRLTASFRSAVEDLVNECLNRLCDCIKVIAAHSQKGTGPFTVKDSTFLFATHFFCQDCARSDMYEDIAKEYAKVAGLSKGETDEAAETSADEAAAAEPAAAEPGAAEPAAAAEPGAAEPGAAEPAAAAKLTLQRRRKNKRHA